MKTFTFEGMPSSGKTSVFNSLKSDFSDKIFFLDETRIEGDYRMDNSELASHYINAEIKKRQLAKSSGYDYVLMDRSFVSTLGFSFANKCLYGRELEWDLNVSFLKSGAEILIPDVIFLFECSKSTSLERSTLRENDYHRDKYWNNEFFLESFFKFYNSEFFLEHFNSAKIIRIDSEKKTIYEICDIVRNVILNI
jgi:thymidylate kinase